MSNEDFTVTLLEDPRVEGTAFPRSGNEGLVKSIAAVPEGKARPASTHITMARILTPSNDGLWRWFDVNGELAHVTASKDYDVAKSGETPYVLVVNGQTFSHDPDAMLKYVQGKGELDGRKKVGLVDRSVPLSTAYADRVLGERVVWAVKDGKIQETQVPIFTVAQYNEAQRDIEFLRQNPTFIAVLTEEQAQQYRHNESLRLREGGVYSPDERLVQHVPSHMQAGTKDVWESLLRVAANDRNYDTFYAGLPNLAKDSGRVAFADSDYFGFNFVSTDFDGCFVGVAPEALDALVKTFIDLSEPSMRLQRDIVQAVRGMPIGSDAAYMQQQLTEVIGRYGIQNK
ncbi:MAG: hypothetical protein ABII01_00690 [Candidatus Woesearchaeota archaeon]